MQHGAPGPDAAPLVLWALPFAGLLLSIALLPMLAPRFWHRRMGAVALGWGLALLAPLGVAQGGGAVFRAVWHGLAVEYLPFVALLLALYVAAGGILLRGLPGVGSPAGNTALLAGGTLLAGLMGTTGAAMVLIHPLLAANAHRRRKRHLVLFFIVLVANAGGATSPLGDPPLFLGFLRGVPFTWPLRHVGLPLLVLAVPLLLAFWLLDRHLAADEAPPDAERPRFRVRGWGNVGLLLVVVATVLAGGLWRPGEIAVLGERLSVARLAGAAVLGAVALVSLLITPKAVRQDNMFSWDPMREVAVLFAAIFVTIGPVFAMLEAGGHGPFAPLLRLTAGADGAPVPLAYFWLTGLLSAFLDNAPTYLVFFGLAGGYPAMPETTLAAISSGAVFFGALTYIGNAPNMMVRGIAAHRGVPMPGFLAYLGLAAALLLPGFALLSLVFFL